MPVDIQQKLKQKLQHLSSLPGVYQMLNTQGKILYVGKARNLKKRVSNYFRSTLDDPKTQALMSQVTDFEVILTSSDNEALLLEANLIKQHHPRYNVLLRDDKSYPYLYLAIHQEFPRLDFYRGAKTRPGRYFGPYPNAGAVRENLTLIQKLFKLRSCRDSFFRNRSRPCLQYQIKRCTAPCVNYVSREDYAQQVKHAIHFLEGKNQLILDNLAKSMEQAAVELKYERAVHFRDLIIRLRQLTAKQSEQKGLNIDVLAASEEVGQMAISVLFIRAGRLIGHKIFYLDVPIGTSIDEALTEFLPQYYLSPLRGDVVIDRIVVSKQLADKEWLQNALREKLNKKLIIIDRPKAEYRQWRELALNNVKYALAQHLAEKNGALRKLEDLQKALHLPNAIQRIECFDVSHSSGEATVASCVVFGLQGLQKKDYRRFNIKDITPGDDYAALRQALFRRYAHLKSTDGELPDLLMIDGGLGQLHQAAFVLEELQINGIELLGIAKGAERKPGKEKLFIWGRKATVELSPENTSFHLIQSIRDEAHRFAITAQRKQLAKKRSHSPLEQIEGIGPKRRQKLLQAFGGMRELLKASVEEIAKVPGISSELAKKIYAQLHDIA